MAKKVEEIEARSCAPVLKKCKNKCKCHINFSAAEMLNTVHAMEKFQRQWAKEQEQKDKDKQRQALEAKQQKELDALRIHTLSAEAEIKLFSLASRKYMIVSIVLVAALAVSLVINAKGHAIFNGGTLKDINDILPTTTTTSAKSTSAAQAAKTAIAKVKAVLQSAKAAKAASKKNTEAEENKEA